MTRKSAYSVAAALLCLFFSVYGFAQTSNATVGGTVADSTGALIPGVTVTATNTGTNIANTVVTNESGAYQFAALQPPTLHLTNGIREYLRTLSTQVNARGRAANRPVGSESRRSGSGRSAGGLKHGRDNGQ